MNDNIFAPENFAKYSPRVQAHLTEVKDIQRRLDQENEVLIHAGARVQILAPELPRLEADATAKSAAAREALEALDKATKELAYQRATIEARTQLIEKLDADWSASLQAAAGADDRPIESVESK
jgi:hypothetical protein